MGLGDNTGRQIYLSIKKGKISYKKDGETKESDFIEGFITKIAIIEKEYEGKKYEEANITIIDVEDKYQLQMKVDSGYFRTFCNAFKSGNPKLRTKITPTYKEEGAKKQSSCFVEQNGSSLKWFYSKANDNLDDVPKLKEVMIGKTKHYDGSEILDFWKKWLLSLEFKEEIEVSSHSQSNGLNEEVKSSIEQSSGDGKPSAGDFEDDSLPF